MRRLFFPLSVVASAGLAAVAVLAALASAATLPALPGPGPRLRGAAYDALTQNAACEGCHAEIAAEWQGSLHRAAWDDPVFQSGYALEPQSFCRDCHAPEHDPGRSDGARHLGVGCVTCHVQDGAVVGSRSLAPNANGHAVVGDARMSTAAACASCHQFDFREPQRALMQSTVDEHRESPHAGDSCQSCHMPMATGADGTAHRNHAFRVQGDPALLRSAVRAEARLAGERLLVVSLATGVVGHAVPTGDLFRRLEVRARIDDESGAHARPVVLARRFRMMPGEHGPTRIQVGDDRLPASGEARSVELRFAEDIAGRRVRWEVAYQRMDGSMAVLFGLDPAKDEVIVASGSLMAGKAE